ncbi:hypothetical protein [Salinicola peritrichatus]|uniref:hypothetical protein n=1 Tax=Salinicola peritrichatus TaxID=1267424 RepID=UPI000DA1B311|nr:hypothetical protein [Salinicola peritrichatus]
MLAERAKKWPEQWKQQGLEEGRQEGRQEGAEKARLETARNLIRETSLADETISSATGLSVSEVAELRAELRH